MDAKHPLSSVEAFQWWALRNRHTVRSIGSGFIYIDTGRGGLWYLNINHHTLMAPPTYLSMTAFHKWRLYLLTKPGLNALYYDIQSNHNQCALCMAEMQGQCVACQDRRYELMSIRRAIVMVRHIHPVEDIARCILLRLRNLVLGLREQMQGV